MNMPQIIFILAIIGALTMLCLACEIIIVGVYWLVSNRHLFRRQRREKKE